jgi:hypothetical protein
MKGYFLSFVTFVTILLAVTSCYYDNEEALYPDVNFTCDTLNVTFSGSIVPLLANNCLSCHSNASAASSAAGIRLEDYADVQIRASAISAAINHTGPFPMPKNGRKLRECLITRFDIWVREGAQND